MSNSGSTPTQEFGINRIYIKDFSLEAPHTPQVFQLEWTPKIELNLDTQVTKILDDGVYEVVLSAQITAKLEDKVAFIVDIKQAGIFTLKGFEEQQMEPMLEIYCPNILFPYLRSSVSNMILEASFPPLYLSPINFEALYAEKKKKQSSIIT